MRGPRISVIMSVYKEPIEWLHESIDSILSQSFADFEYIIVCDNPSYDEGIALLKEYANKDNRIRLLFNEENIGLTKSLNKGIILAKGEFVARIDADDIAMPVRFEKQLSFMERHPEIVASGTGSFSMTGNKLKINHRLESNRDLWTMLVFDSPISHPSAIFRRVIDGQPVRYNEDFRYSQDYALWLTLIENHQIANIDEPLIKYRISDDQISTSNHSQQQSFALKNQQRAVDLLRLRFSEKEMAALQIITRNPEKECRLDDVKRLIASFLSQIIYRTDLDYDKVARHLVLIYANYLPKKQSVIPALWNLIVMSYKIRRFYFYSFLSFFNKYVIKVRSLKVWN